MYIIFLALLLLIFTNTKIPPTVLFSSKNYQSPWFRYLAVVFPVSSKVLRTKFNTQVAISVSWAVSLLLSCPALFLHGLVESKAEDDQVGSNSLRLVHFRSDMLLRPALLQTQLTQGIAAPI